MSDFELPSSAVERKPSSRAKLPTKAELPPLPPSEAEPEKTQEAKASATDTPQYDQEELLRIFDEVIFSGEYAEDVTIRNRLKVRFRTRTSGEVDEITRIVDSTQANLLATLDQKRSVLNLQYSLISYQGKNLAGLKVEDRAKFISAIPGPIIGALLIALAKFDNKVFEACREGEENF